eukprot:CAMPEP_0197832938 /NCGR_PEP_ID=MMETSP1437-20131217/17015_1 /TAXON_ID=49252 ORGANISM="Eucampia antarctica, Strain CCMP1452" /NCGR_SAMPLE_ID=MMETSP1437 /ASSEMBLY_ACC=CAM_ASM_001096 /LENGTH=426 /DNA_ID=CAMNT_0043436619 /DNA_START=63 /DNA_END=1343 /DNA_ORIENTATION=-
MAFNNSIIMTVIFALTLMLLPLMALSQATTTDDNDSSSNLKNKSSSDDNNVVPKKTTTAPIVGTCWDTLNTNEPPEENWGTYYDPKGIFCGDYDCFRILGFCYEEWGKTPPTTKQITQSYRKMGRVWHPDKNTMKGAKERFVKINKAYEVLTDATLRKEFDYMRERPDEYYYKYGSNVLFAYAPKSDTIGVVAFLLLLASVAAWYMQKARWQQIADRVISAAVEGLGPREGGSAQSIEVREQAVIIAQNRKEGATDEKDVSALSTSKADSINGKEKKPKGPKLTKKELKEQANEELRPVIVELVNDMKDFGAGFHQPTWRDILVLKMAKWPVSIFFATVWQLKYFYRRTRKSALNEEEREVLTRRAVGDIAWEAATDEDRQEMVTMDLWITDKLEEWRELQEVRQLSAGDQKRYNRWKKKQGSKVE